MRPAGPSECRCRARPGRASEGLGELVGVLGAGRTHIGAADLRLGIAAALPVGALDALAGFQILVDLEEVLDLQAVELRDVGQLLATHLTAVTDRHGDDLVVAAGLVAHPEHAQGAAADQTPRERRLLEQHETVQRIAVLPEGPFDEPVVVRVPGGVNSIRSNRILPLWWSTSYLFRFPRGISMVTSNSTTAAPLLLPRRPLVKTGTPYRGDHGFERT